MFNARTVPWGGITVALSFIVVLVSVSIIMRQSTAAGQDPVQDTCQSHELWLQEMAIQDRQALALERIADGLRATNRELETTNRHAGEANRLTKRRSR